jgi:hypothetical protein
MSKRHVRLEDTIKPSPRPQKTVKELCIDEIGAVLMRHNCRLVAIPVGAIAEDGRFEYRSAEIRIEENPPRPQAEVPTAEA